MRKWNFLWMLVGLILCVGCSKQAGEIPESSLSSEMDVNSEKMLTDSELHTEKFLTNSNSEDWNTENLLINSEESTEDSEVNSSEYVETEGSIITDEIEPLDTDIVLIKEYIPDIYIDLKYATTDNFTQTVIYEDFDAYLRYGTVKKLMQVQEELKQRGYSLLIWDAYRPVEAQFKLWEICPDAGYVSDPNKGFSKHSRGNTVDITLVTLEGEAVEMPTGFDDFSEKADRDYTDVSKTAAENSRMLEELMENAGLKGYYGEWWHYSDLTEYEVVCNRTVTNN